MPSDIPADVAYLGGVWFEGVLYGNVSRLFHILTSLNFFPRVPVSWHAKIFGEAQVLRCVVASSYFSLYARSFWLGLTEETANYLPRRYCCGPHRYDLNLVFRVLVVFATVMFALSTTHVGLAVYELLQGFVYQRDNDGGPPAYFRNNVFPKRKAVYIINVSPRMLPSRRTNNCS